ncbi:hypothetical protein CDAR_171011 [Caerostris darwini]|uniref:BPTI/Kunitz inhibitor domain-containing protein n=1 Tax=Caerostris darwini TaxID=1538125 RepID=A0AAV4P7R7_9ARAC|nr:hypothetical protein CDAR_171011 [Caerostris darwini]
MRTLIFFLCLTFLGTTFVEGEDPPETGMRRAYFPRWNYDPKTGKCNEFVYGGTETDMILKRNVWITAKENNCKEDRAKTVV